MKKRLLSILLALYLVLGMLPRTALAAESDFIIENGVLTKYTGPGGDVTIPNSVIGIDTLAFSGCSSLTSVTIPASVTSIGHIAFGYCSSLTNISVASENSAYSTVDGVLFNADQTLLHTYPMGKISTSYNIPNSVTSIGRNAFDRCSSLNSVIIPTSVTSIGQGAFSYCSSLTSVTIPTSVTSIESHAFSYCSSLTSVTIPDGVTSIADWTFTNCSSLTSLTIPTSVTSIGDGTFFNCKNVDYLKKPLIYGQFRRT